MIIIKEIGDKIMCNTIVLKEPNLTYEGISQCNYFLLQNQTFTDDTYNPPLVGFIQGLNIKGNFDGNDTLYVNIPDNLTFGNINNVPSLIFGVYQNSIVKANNIYGLENLKIESPNGDITLNSLNSLPALYIENNNNKAINIQMKSNVLIGKNDLMYITLDKTSTAGSMNLVVEPDYSNVSGVEVFIIRSITRDNEIELFSNGNAYQTRSIFVEGNKGLTIKAIAAERLQTISAEALAGNFIYPEDMQASIVLVKGGTGNDTFNALTNFATTKTYDGGQGRDTLTVSSSTTSSVTTEGKLLTNIQNFEILKIGDALANNMDLTLFSQTLDTLVLSDGTGAYTVTLPDIATVYTDGTAHSGALTLASKTGLGSKVNFGIKVDAGRADHVNNNIIRASSFDELELFSQIVNTQTADQIITGGKFTLTGWSSWTLSGAVTADVIDASGLYQGKKITMSATPTNLVDASFLRVIGSESDDTITGSSAGDDIRAGSGDDTINADTNDEIDGGQGNDTVRFAANVNTGLTDSELRNLENIVITKGSSGSYDFSVQTEALSITGSAFDDTISGGTSVNRVSLGDGDDTYNGNVGRDIITDSVGASGASVVSGGEGTDSLNLILDGDGATLTVDSVEDLTVTLNSNYAVTINDAGNSVRLFTSKGSGTLTLSSTLGTAVTAVTTGVELIMNSLSAGTVGMTITGSGGPDVLYASAGPDTINAGDGDDTINSGDGNDTIDAGGGQNTINSGAGADIINSGLGNDTINAGDGDDIINAGAGNDTINAGDGDDTIIGGGDVDTITGGAGADNFVVTVVNAVDTVTDFDIAVDEIQFDLSDLLYNSLEIKNGNSVTITAARAGTVLNVNGAVNAGAGDAIFVVTGATYASSANLELAIEDGGARQITLASSSANNDRYIVVWSDGTDGHLGYYNAATGATTFDAGGSYVELMTLSGIDGTEIATLTTANFNFIA